MVKTRPSFDNSNSRSRQEKMGVQTPTTASGNAAPAVIATDQQPYRSLAQSPVDAEVDSQTTEVADSSSYRRTSLDGGTRRTRRNGTTHQTEEQLSQTSSDQSKEGTNATDSHDLPEQLAQLIHKMIPGTEGQEMGEAFRLAADYPPITKQSLGELDIQSIITNIKLRHDVNFDRDLSFRPNLDGMKGQEKMKAAKQYWKALTAELELYALIFQGSPQTWTPQHPEWPAILNCAQRRIPKIFTTIQEVLKSLVPDRDHGRVDEHLDVPMLMREIERGVCDLVRLAEWMAHLLKEHCAPMRDPWVDKMVEWTRDGVAQRNSELIVNGLRELLGILEAMKLDVANHQIRNLKSLLIEDTVHFERHFHLERLVNNRARVDIDAAHQWYKTSVMALQQPTLAPQVAFNRAVIAKLFFKDDCVDFPETFYLDQDRLRVLKAEIDDMIYFEVCMNMFRLLLTEFGYLGPVPDSSRHVLRSSLLAIMGEGTSHGASYWWRHSENITTELIRQALVLSRSPQMYSLEILQTTNEALHKMFSTCFEKHAASIKAKVLAQVSACIARHTHSTPMDIFHSLVAIPPPPPPPASQPMIQAPFPITFPKPPVPDPLSADQIIEVSNRITHILILHWRVWGDIAYIINDSAPSSPSESTIAMRGSAPATPVDGTAKVEASLPSTLKPDEPQEAVGNPTSSPL